MVDSNGELTRALSADNECSPSPRSSIDLPRRSMSNDRLTRVHSSLSVLSSASQRTDLSGERAERLLRRHMEQPFEDKRDGYTAMSLVRTQSQGDAADARVDWRNLCQFIHGACHNKIYAIDPHTHRFLPYWDLLMVLTIILQCFILPYQVGFCLAHEQKSIYHLCQRRWPFILDAIYVVDMCFNCITVRPHPVYKRWVSTPIEIVHIYFRGHFWRDVITVLPYNVLASLLIPLLGPRFRAIRLLRLLGLIRLARFGGLILRYEALMDIPFTWLKLVKLFIQLTMAVHWMACAWGFVLFVGYYLDLSAGEEQGITWVSVLREQKPELFSNSRTETPMELYTASLYWSTMTITSIGYGDITATNSIEAWFSSIAMGLCGLIWAYIIGSICAIAAAFDDDSREHEATMESVNRMIRSMEMPRDVKVKLREYFMVRKSLRHRMQQAQLVRYMSPQLQTSVLKALEDSYLHQMWFLRSAQSHGYLLSIFETFVFVMYPPQETLQLAGSMVVLLQGLVLRNARIATQGSVWGIEEILLENPRLHTLYSAISLAYCDLQHITKHAFQELTLHYPKERKRIRKLAIKLAICRAVSRQTVRPSWDIEQEEDVEGQEENTAEPGYIIEIKSRLNTVESKLDKVLDILQEKGSMNKIFTGVKQGLSSHVTGISENALHKSLGGQIQSFAHFGRKKTVLKASVSKDLSQVSSELSREDSAVRQDEDSALRQDEEFNEALTSRT